jgi:conjugal transfer mating pair stabilization protein TraG
MYVLETIGSGEMLWTLFNAIAALLRPGGGSLMQSFLMMGTAIGSVAAIGYTVFRNELRPFLSWFISSQVIIVGLLSPVSTVMIRDVLTGNVRTVDNVPFALAFTASTLSSLGTGITRAIEVVFQAAPSYVGGRGFYSGGVQPRAFDQLAYTQTGFMFASHVMAQMKGVQLANDDLAENLKEFVNQCVVYDALIGTNYTMHDLKRSDDIWGLVSRTASQLRGFAWREVERAPDGTFVNSTGTTIVTCRVGVQRFNRMWTEANESLITKFQDKLCEQFGIRQDSTRSLSHSIASNLPGALNKLTHSARNASQHLQQQIMISSLLTSNDRKSVELGGSPNFEVRRAYLQQRDTYQTIGQTIAQTLPSLKNVLEALVYALFIFVVLLAMFPGGWGVLTFYTKILLWLQLWPPLFSILNFIMTESLSSAAAGAMGTAQGITIANMVGLSNIAQDMAATAGYLSSMIPILSWALIERGGYAFVSMASGILGVSQQAASTAAMEKTTGNYSFGNVSVEGVQAYNTSMLKQDSSASYTGGHFATNEGITAQNFTADGETILNRSESHLPVTPSIRLGQEEILQEAITKADGYSQSYGAAASNSSRMAATNYLELSKQASTMRAAGVTYDNQETTNVMNEAANNYEKLKQFGEKYGISKELVNQHATTASGGLNIPFVVGHLGGTYQNTETAQATASAATEELNQIMKSDSYRDSMSHMHQASVNKSFNTNDQNVNQLADNVSGSYEKSKQYEQFENKSRDMSKTLQEEYSKNKNFGSQVDANLTQDWVNKVGASKISTMSTVEMQRSASQFSDEARNDYRRSIFQKIDALDLKKGFDAQYQGHALQHNEQDLSKAFESRQAHIRQESKGSIGEVDDVEKYRATQMMAMNTATLAHRGSASQSKVEKGEIQMREQIKEKSKDTLGKIQSVSAINSHQKMSKRNDED